MTNDKIKEAYEKVIAVNNKVYGESVTNRWIKRAKIDVVFYPTNTVGIAQYFKGQEIADSLYDFDILDDDKLIGKLKIADTIYSDKTYYLLIVNGSTILYELENYTKLVAVTIQMPDSLMVSLIISASNIRASANGIEYHPDSPPFSTCKRDAKSHGFKIYYSDNDDGSFVYHFSEQDDDQEHELVDAIKYTTVPLVEEPSKHYIILKNNITKKNDILLVENQITKLFPKYKLPIFPQVLAVQLLTYDSVVIQKSELVEPQVENYH